MSLAFQQQAGRVPEEAPPPTSTLEIVLWVVGLLAAMGAMFLFVRWARRVQPEGYGNPPDSSRRISLPPGMPRL
jgi:hypothetical protein